MKVFSLYWKIMKKNLPMILLYVGIFSGITLLMIGLADKENVAEFKQSKSQVAFFDYDNTGVSTSMKDYISNIADIVEIEDEETALKDAIFFEKIDCIIRIKSEFTTGIKENKEAKVEMNVNPKTIDARYIESAVQNYCNTIKAYTENTDLDFDQIIEKTNEDLANKTQVEMLNEKKAVTSAAGSMFLNYIPYLAYSTIIVGISATMSSIRKKNTQRRMFASPLKPKKLNFELTLGHFTFALCIFAFFLVLWYFVNPNFMKEEVSIYHIINLIVFTLSVVSVSFFIGGIIKGKNAQTAASNVISLGSSFLGGVFVPQEFLSQTVLMIAKFTPAYWYVFANNNLLALSEFNWATLKDSFWIPVLVQLGFTFMFWVLAIAVNKNRQTQE